MGELGVPDALLIAGRLKTFRCGASGTESSDEGSVESYRATCMGCVDMGSSGGGKRLGGGDKWTKSASSASSARGEVHWDVSCVAKVRSCAALNDCERSMELPSRSAGGSLLCVQMRLLAPSASSERMSEYD